MLWGKNMRLTRRIEQHQNQISTIECVLKNYLAQVSDQKLSEEDSDWRFNLLDYAEELIIIAKLIRRDLADAVIRQAQSSEDLCSEDKSEIEELYAKTLEHMEKASAVLVARDDRVAKRFIQDKEGISIYCRTVRKLRLERVRPGRTVETNLLDMVDCLRRVNSHLTVVAYSIARANRAVVIVDRGIIDANPDESWVTEPEPKTHEKSE
jgi:Na+/phosphate symporter